MGPFPWMLMLALFLLALSQSASGLKCYVCGALDAAAARKQFASDISINMTGNGTIGILSGTGTGDMASIFSGDEQSRQASTRGQNDSCKGESKDESIDCPPKMDVCTKSDLQTGKMFKRCGKHHPDVKMECHEVNQKGVKVGCICNTDLCNGGRPLKNGFGLMSFLLILLGAYYVC